MQMIHRGLRNIIYLTIIGIKLKCCSALNCFIQRCSKSLVLFEQSFICFFELRRRYTYVNTKGIKKAVAMQRQNPFLLFELSAVDCQGVKRQIRTNIVE